MIAGAALWGVVVWRVESPAELPTETQDCLASTLDLTERVRWRAAGGSSRALELLVGQALLRACLGAVLGEKPARLALTRKADGKPALAVAEPPAHASVSHSGTHLVVAATQLGPVGIDVEVIRPHSQRVARRFFDPAEQEELEAVAPGERDVAFFRMWTVKEACAKAWGTGLRGALSCRPVSLAPHGVTDGARWRWVELSPELAASVAVLERGEGYGRDGGIDTNHGAVGTEPALDAEVTTLTLEQLCAALA